MLPNNHNEQYLQWAEELLNGADKKEIIAAILEHSYHKLLDKNEYRKLTPITRKFSADLRNMEGKTRLYIAKGRNDGLNRKELANFIVEQTGIAKKAIEDIEVLDSYSFVSVPFEDAERIIARLKSLRFGKKHLFVEKAKEVKTKRPNSPKRDKNTRAKTRKEKKLLKEKSV